MSITPHYKQIASVLFSLVFLKTSENFMVISLPAKQLFKRSVDPPFATDGSLAHRRWVLELWDPNTSLSEDTSLA